jgi:hypothetical protein
MMTLATLRRLVFTVLVAGALCAPATGALAQAPAPPPPPGIGVRLLQGPASGIEDPRAHEYIIDHLAPGTTISRQVGFSNGDAEPVDLAFYAVAADVRDGGFEPGASHAANELTAWTSFSPTSATVAPGQLLPVTVTIAVPADATAGERYAAALAENFSPPPAGGGVSSVSRVGIRIYLSVGPGGAPPTAFSVDSMTAQRDANGNPLVTAQVHNTGGRAVDLSGRLDLSNGPSSLSAGPFTVASVATLAPGTSGAVTVPLDRALPNGPWDAKITLESGRTSETVTGRLTFPTDAGASSGTSTVKTDAGLPLSLLLAVGVAVAAALVVLWFVIRRRRRRDDAPVAATDPAVPSGRP